MEDFSSERELKRYDEMVETMVKMGEELTAEERELLFKGYWKVLARRRDAWEVFSRIELKEESKGNDKKVRFMKEYKHELEAQIIGICTKVLSIVDEHLIPSISNPDAYMFYYKMKGDYYRYIAEFKTGKDREEAADEAIKAYEASMSTAVSVLPRAHYFRLGLDLNLSVFHHVILDEPERAIEIAKQAIHEATLELDELDKEVYQKSTKMLGLLNRNIKQWKLMDQ